MDSLDQKMPTESMMFTDNSINHLNETRKWTLFISILGLIFMGILIIVVPSMLLKLGFNSPNNSAALSLIPLLLLMVVYFFPIYYLLRFSNYCKSAITNSDSSSMETAFKYLKLTFRFIGILSIIILGIYVIVGLVALAVYIVK